MSWKNDDLGPRREGRPELLDEALALWAEDARRVGARADGEGTARHVLTRIHADPTGRAYLPQHASFGYAAAAAALLAVGLVGAWLANPAPGAPQTTAVGPDLEQGSLAVLRLVELEQLAVGR